MTRKNNPRPGHRGHHTNTELKKLAKRVAALEKRHDDDDRELLKTIPR
jgi:hypothetical protein